MVAHAPAHTPMDLCVHVCESVHVCVCMCVCACACVCVCMCESVHMFAHTPISHEPARGTLDRVTACCVRDGTEKERHCRASVVYQCVGGLQEQDSRTTPKHKACPLNAPQHAAATAPPASEDQRAHACT